jgi:hypothetical protein
LPLQLDRRCGDRVEHVVIANRPCVRASHVRTRRAA